MSDNMKAWLSWKGMSKLSCKQRRTEAMEMVKYYSENPPINVPCKRKYRTA